MRKTIQPVWTMLLLSINAAILVLFSGCTTPPERSFNNDFGMQLPTQPMYYIKDEDDKHFRICVHQGVPSNGEERIDNVKTAASAIAQSECKRLGWERWQMNYIKEGNQGWMYEVVADVMREQYIPPALTQTNSSP